MTQIFVFGSNLAGRHGAGSAREAVRSHGARYGRAFGRQGNAYAIPTKDENLRSLPLIQILAYVTVFIEYARDHSDLTFNVVAIGCGLAGYTPHEIAPMFTDAPDNVRLPDAFQIIVSSEQRKRQT
jgi:hypothetical protein